MKKVIMISVLVILQVACGTKKIVLKKNISKDVIRFESESNHDISLLFDKKDIIDIFPRLLSENVNKQSRIEDSTLFVQLKDLRQDTLTFQKYRGVTLDLCVYNLLVDGKVKIFNKNNNGLVHTIYSKRSKSKLGQLNQDFYYSRPIKSTRFFYSFLLAHGE
jgi:hypothetical protein